MITVKNTKVYTGSELRERIRSNARPTGIMFAYKRAVPSTAATLIPIKNRLGSVEPIICQVANFHAKGSVRRTKAVIEVITSHMKRHYVSTYDIDGFIELSTPQMKTILGMTPEDQFNLVTRLFTHSKLYTRIETQNSVNAHNRKKTKEDETQFVQQLEARANPSPEQTVLQTLQTLREEILDRIERLGAQVARLSVSIGELQADMQVQTKEVKALGAPLVENDAPATQEYKNLPPAVKRMRIHDLIIQAKELQRRMDDIDAHSAKKTSVELA